MGLPTQLLKTPPHFARAIMAARPSAFYPMDDFRASVVMRDASGNGVNGTYGPAASANFAPLVRRARSCFFINSSGGGLRAEVADHASNSFAGNDFTILVMWQSSPAVTAEAQIISKELVGADFPEFSLRQEATTGKVIFYYLTSNSAPGINSITTASAVNNTRPRLIAARRSGTTMNILVDGVIDATGSFSGTIWNSANPATFGCAKQNGGSYAGFSDSLMSHVAFFNGTALSDAYIKQLYALSLRP